MCNPIKPHETPDLEGADRNCKNCLGWGIVDNGWCTEACQCVIKYQEEQAKKLLRYKHKRNLSEYVSVDPFAGEDESGVKLRQCGITRIRKKHDCLGLMGNEPHEISPFTHEFAFRDSALVDGEWCTCYFCIQCLDKYMDKMGQ